jgi:Aldo/keto reductase family
MAWLLAQEAWIVSIPGTRKLARLEENLAAADLELSGTELTEIKTASAAITVQGRPLPRGPGAAYRPVERPGTPDRRKRGRIGLSAAGQ